MKKSIVAIAFAPLLSKGKPLVHKMRALVARYLCCKYDFLFMSADSIDEQPRLPLPPQVAPITPERLEKAHQCNQQFVTEKLQWLSTFSQGFAVTEPDGEWCGHAWLYSNQVFHFVSGYALHPHPQMMIGHTVFVEEKFRRRGIGFCLNQAQLASTPPAKLLVVSVHTRNTPARHNWEKLQFHPQLRLTIYRWFRKVDVTRLEALRKTPAMQLIAGQLRSHSAERVPLSTKEATASR